MSERIALKPGTAICESNGVTITVGNLIGVGGSALVYEGKKITSDKPDGEFKLIKEVYPNFEARYPDTIKRCEDGKIVCDSKESLSLFETIKQFARNEVNNSRELAADVTGRRNDFFFNKHELVEDVWSEDTLCSVNGNMYILIDTTQGKTLEKIIKEYRFGAKNEYSIHSLYDVVVYVIGIVNALKQFHNHNPQYLHLDVSPDNIYVSNSKLVRLIDFNSASCKDSDGVFVSLSQKVGYSAPEICFDEKNPCVQSDLFSVTAVLFNMVFGALYDVRISEIKTNDGLRDYLSDNYNKCRKSVLLRDISPKATYILLDILVKGLNWKPENRFENCDEMLQSLEQLKDEAHPRKVYLIDTRANITLPEHCLPRDEMINKIRDRLLSDNHVFVSGEGGSGKSSIAAMFVKRFDNDYETILFCEYSSDFRSLIMDMPFHGIDDCSLNSAMHFKSLVYDEAVQQVYYLKYEQLKKLDAKTLIVIENYNVDYESNFDNVKAEANFLHDVRCHIIFNTRTNYVKNDYLHMDDVSDEDAYEFFSNTAELVSPDKSGIMELIAYSDKNFLVMNLLARLLKLSRDHDPKKLLALLHGNKVLTPRIGVEQYHNGINVTLTDSLENHLLRVFDVSGLDESLLGILSAMTLIPYSGIEKSEFEEALNLDDWDNKVDKLVELGWIIRNGETICLHQAISDLLYRTEGTTPNFELLDEFISETSYLPALVNEDALYRRRELYVVADFYARKIKGNGFGCIETYYGIARAYHVIGDYNNSLKFYEKALSLSLVNCDIFEKGSHWVFTIYMGIVNVYDEIYDDNMVIKYSDMALEYAKSFYEEESNNIYAVHDMAICNMNRKQYSESLNYYKKALDLVNASNCNDQEILIDIYGGMGQCYEGLHSYDEALDCYEKKLRISKSIYGEDSYSIATSYYCIGNIFLTIGDNSQAINYSNMAIEVLHRDVGQIHPELAAGYELIGKCYYNSGEWDTALNFFERALKIRTIFYEENSLPIAESYYNISACYFSKGQYNESIDTMKKAENIFEATANSNNLEMIYSSILNVYKYLKMSRHIKIYESKLKALKLKKKQNKLGSYQQN